LNLACHGRLTRWICAGGMRHAVGAWARVKGETLQGFEDNSVMSRTHLRNGAVRNDRVTHLSRPGIPCSLSLDLSLFLSLSLSLSLSLLLALSRLLALSLSLSLSLPGLSGTVRFSDVPHWTKSARTPHPPPLSWSVCLNELQVCVRMHMCVGVGVRVRVHRKPHPQTFQTDVDTDCKDTPSPECSVRSDELPVSMRMCVCAWACVGMRGCVRVRRIARTSSFSDLHAAPS
jgi:hypothetical protein